MSTNWNELNHVLVLNPGRLNNCEADFHFSFYEIMFYIMSYNLLISISQPFTGSSFACILFTVTYLMDDHNTIK